MVNWIAYYLGEGLPGRGGSLLLLLPVVVVVVADEDVKDEHDESAYVPWEQPDDFLISKLRAGKEIGKKEGEGGGGGRRCD